jgi:GT2 family glycosyltransferase
MNSTVTPDVSVIIVSFNTRDLLRECLHTLKREAQEVSYETIVIDNASEDGSTDMVATEFPEAILLRSRVNFGFGAANNWGFRLARGRYVVLLKADAFLCPGALSKAIEYMEADPDIGLGGARLIGRDGSCQPSGRTFPSVLNNLLTFGGLSTTFSRSRFLDQEDWAWRDLYESVEVDWVPGAFSIVRREVLEKTGYFDESFFLYYEEVDLCRRIKAKGYSIWHWPDVVVVHPGQASSEAVKPPSIPSSPTQLILWRMRSELLYYRKHHGWVSAWLAMQTESLKHRLRAWKNATNSFPGGTVRNEESKTIVALVKQAWRETQGGLVSPPWPW